MPSKIVTLSAALFALPLPALGATIIVDTALTANCLTTYNAATRSCGSGNGTAHNNVSSGLSAVGPGDTLQLRVGTYRQLAVSNSGTQNQPIVIEAYPGETVTVTDSSEVALWIIGRSDVTIRNIRVRNSRGTGRLENSTRIRIDNISSSNPGASGTTSGLKFVRTTYSRVSDSDFDGGADLVTLQDDSNLNLFENNTFGASTHSLISVRCSSQNIIRGNEFDNPTQKAMEIYDCEGTSDAPIRFDDAMRNVVERNSFLGTAASSGDNDYNAIQHGGQRTIVRYNIFTTNLGGGVNYQHYADESEFVYGNRLYNNTFYNNRCFGIIGQSGPSNQIYDNRATNNLLFRNVSCSGGAQQVRIEDPDSVILANNTLANSDPGFDDAANGDLRLIATSNQIDAGAFVTRAVASGIGTLLVVHDASYFIDGFGIAGEGGDSVRVQGSPDTARVTAVDYARNTLTLDRSLSWSAGAGVHLSYSGGAPDVGAFEYGVTTPNPPTDLTAH
jgi:parallel beta-helix repeat protein